MAIITRKALIDFLREASTHTIIYLMECEKETLEYIYIRLRTRQRFERWRQTAIKNFLNHSNHNPNQTK